MKKLQRVGCFSWMLSIICSIFFSKKLSSVGLTAHLSFMKDATVNWLGREHSSLAKIYSALKTLLSYHVPEFLREENTWEGFCV